jgi:hypothetical protein
LAGWASAQEERRGARGYGPYGPKEREREEKEGFCLFFFKPKLQIHFLIEVLNKFDILFLKQLSQ